MLRLIAGLDQLVARTRPAWRWLGQLALATLGVHLATDHLDDAMGGFLAGLAVPWPDPEVPLVAGTWVAVGLELLTVSWSAWALARSWRAEEVGWRGWWQRASVHSVAAPLTWGVLCAAGCWTVAMAAEDMVAGLWPGVAPLSGVVAAGLVAWRLALPGAIALVRSPPVPARRREGWVWLPVIVPVGGFALRHGVPVWGLW